MTIESIVIPKFKTRMTYLYNVILTSSLHLLHLYTLLHTHTLTPLGFQVSSIKTCWLLIFKHDFACWLLFNHDLSCYSARFCFVFTEFNRVDRVRTSLTEFKRFVTGSVIIWLWNTSTDRFALV